MEHSVRTEMLDRECSRGRHRGKDTMTLHSADVADMLKIKGQGGTEDYDMIVINLMKKMLPEHSCGVVV